MTRGEGRRLLLMSAGLALGLAWLFGRPRREPALALPPPPASAVLAVASAADPSTAGSAPVALDPALLASADDRAIDVVVEPALEHLVAAVHALSDAEVERAARGPGAIAWADLQGPGGTADLGALARARGRFLRVEGRLVGPLFERALPARAGAAPVVVLQGVLRARGRGYFVTLTDEPAARGRPGAQVEVSGALLKLHRYRPGDTSRGELVELPHLVARGLRPVTEAPLAPRGPDLPGAAMVVLLLGTGAALAAYVLASRRGDARHDAWRRAALRRPGRSASSVRRVPSGRGTAQDPGS